MKLQRSGGVVVAAVALMAGLALSARAQQPAKPAAGDEAEVKRMVIENGPHRTVHYFSSKGFSPGEESALRDLERAENGMAAAANLQDLRGLYLRNEVALERRRGQVNPLLYGYSSQYNMESFSGGGFSGFAGYPYGYPYYPYGVGGFGNVGYSWGNTSSASATNSLSPGVGNEGVIKNEMARILTDPSASEAYTRAARAYDNAVARVADMKLGERIGVVKGERTVGPQVTLIMKKDNEKITGNLVSDDPDWITVDTAKEEVSVRKADVDRIVRVKSDVKPASR
jgi:hypothetical protein